MLTPYLPYPPASGGQIRTLNLLKYLCINNDITLISLYKNNKEKKYSSYLMEYCSKVYACKRAEKPWQIKILVGAIFSRKPLLIVRNFSEEAQSLLQELLSKEKYDVIHAETFYIMPHIPKTNIPILLVEQTIEYQVYRHFVKSLPFFIKPLVNLDVYKLKFWERFYWKKAQVVAAVSDADRAVIKQDAPEINTVIIPNGAGDEMFVHTLEKKKNKLITFLFQGNFFWLQNLEAANYLVKKVFPMINKIYPTSQLIIAGQQTQRINIQNQPNIKLIEIKSDKSDEVKKLYLQATLFLAPIFGPGGTRLKILASMASGLPVISTKTGIQGLELTDNKHVLLANTPDEFCEKIQLILSNSTLYDSIRQNAYIQAKEKYNWKNISILLEKLYKKIQKNI